MNINELEKTLVEEGFNSDAYSLIEEQKDETLCLRFEDNQWCVYYSERGLDTGKIYFANENSACEYFLDKMRSDPTTRANWSSGFSMQKGGGFI